MEWSGLLPGSMAEHWSGCELKKPMAYREMGVSINSRSRRKQTPQLTEDLREIYRKKKSHI